MIGIIGGAGVAATNKLSQLIEETYTKNGAFRDAHHPEMIIWQATQAPSRSMYYEGRGASFIPDYIKIGLSLKQMGASRLAMCCNTAHMAISELEEGIGLPFINLLEAVANEVGKLGVKRLGIMCSDGLAKRRVYDTYILKASPSIEIIYPTSAYQEKVTAGICNAKNIKRYLPQDDLEHPFSLFSEVSRHLISNGVDCILAGCTDILNVYDPNFKDVAYIDSLKVLSKAIVSSLKME